MDGGDRRLNAKEDVRVLVVDDSPSIVRLLGGIFRSESGIDFVGSASNGQEALLAIERLEPDVVILDVEMPVLDGLATLRRIRPRWPRLPVIMFSTLTERGAVATVQALSYGANDYLAKPTQQGSLDEAIQSVRASLVPLVRMWSRIGRGLRTRDATEDETAIVPAPSGRAPVVPSPARSVAGPTASGAVVARREDRVCPIVRAVVIGSSTGGPAELARVVPRLPADLPVPLMLVQHMPKMFTKIMAERLNANSAISVKEAAPGMVAEPGTLFVAQGGMHLVIRSDGDDVVFDFDDGPPENSCKPAVDVLFRSAVAHYGGHLLGVVLTGMGQDGMLGAEAIDRAGGAVIVQDEETSVVWGMPGAVARAGLASEVLPIAEIPTAITRRVTAGRLPSGGLLRAVPAVPIRASS